MERDPSPKAPIVSKAQCLILHLETQSVPRLTTQRKLMSETDLSASPGSTTCELKDLIGAKGSYGSPGSSISLSCLICEVGMDKKSTYLQVCGETHKKRQTRKGFVTYN